MSDFSLNPLDVSLQNLEKAISLPAPRKRNVILVPDPGPQFFIRNLVLRIGVLFLMIYMLNGFVVLSMIRIWILLVIRKSLIIIF